MSIHSHSSLPSTPTEPDPEPDMVETEPKLIPLMEVRVYSLLCLSWAKGHQSIVSPPPPVIQNQHSNMHVSINLLFGVSTVLKENAIFACIHVCVC